MPTTHVTSLELSRRLKELKVPQNSHFVWFNNSGITGDAFWTLGYKEEIIDNGVTLYPEKTVSAYLASELGEMLPEIPHYRLRIEKTGSSWDIEYRASCYDAPMGELVFACLEPSEADARAKMLIYLIENHLISVEELGK